jgi:RNA polymerase sigma-70 factor (ECF subfamily)
MTLPASAASAASAPDDDVRAAQGGDRQAFERLYRTHVGRVFSVCVRMCGNRSEAEERTQDAFVRAWEKLPQFRGESSFATWLHRLTVNVVLNARDGASRTRGREIDDGAEALEATAGHAAPAGLSLDLEQAIGGLPAGARRVFTLFDVYGYSHEEIADQLGITTGGSKAQLHRARLLLRQALSR